MYTHNIGPSASKAWKLKLWMIKSSRGHIIYTCSDAEVLSNLSL